MECYPGARFDSESYTYGYSFSKELLDEWELIGRRRLEPLGRGFWSFLRLRRDEATSHQDAPHRRLRRHLGQRDFASRSALAKMPNNRGWTMIEPIVVEFFA